MPFFQEYDIISFPDKPAPWLIEYRKDWGYISGKNTVERATTKKNLKTVTKPKWQECKQQEMWQKILNK